MEDVISIVKIRDPGKLNDYFWAYSAKTDDIYPYVIPKGNRKLVLEICRRLGEEINIRYENLSREIVEIIEQNKPVQERRGARRLQEIAVG